MQNQKLRQFINEQLYPFSPHYKKLFDQNRIDPRQIRTIEDLKHIPFSSKLDLLDNKPGENRFREFVLQPDPEKIKKAWPPAKLLSLAGEKIVKGADYVQEKISREYRPNFMTFTTGTTNRPTPFLYSRYDVDNLYLYGERMISAMSIGSQDKLVNMFPYAPHLAFWQVAFGGVAGCVLIMSTGGGKVMGTDGNIKVLSMMQPAVIIGVPSYVYHVLRTANEQGVKLPSVKKVVLGAGRVDESLKARLRYELEGMGAQGVSVFGTYGFTEARCAWVECPTVPGITSGYHLYPDKEIFEIIDPQTGEVKGEGGDGEIVYTTIDSRGSAVLRYRTGDFVKGGITWEPCPHCQKTVPRLSSDITRISDTKDLNLSKVKGQLVNFDNFAAALNEFNEIREWQIEIKKRNNDPHDLDEMFIYLCPNKGVDTAKLEREIKSKIMLATEVSPNAIMFVSFEEMVNRLQLETANKEKRILDNRPKN
ncbi:MAG: hypothetical protein A3D10_01390 [Omnitrophica WOR_2 bacterium RIFCSPHIGHO2_02_FULL_48_11]|nr:MAG: hypothetical protein A3D10_01390 [Omnitrophica WOR_2 bacterium RIFCSPHIGHO2_02_FULL_48_11]